ncbi:hypothetical protein [Streptomyces sp. CHB9.2]|uniref:hypothetical protein n=1 Tax=Streptomyces sp. CHB9.2 TaxID=2841670 RepID=UPI0020951D41|nr:hypothetical protein [Streptomyces sp. CHB9.2]MCO6704853.1 hypothetical protein [Streptomyces sp. CHB9.2]
MGNRKAATDMILRYIDKILPGSPNTEFYRTSLAAMSDKQFGEFMNRLESGEETLTINVPNLGKHKLDLQRNLAIAKELGHEFFEHLLLTDPTTGQLYQTPVKYLVIDLPLRRQVQLLESKSTIPENNKHIDELSGQSTGPSKGSKISFPELQVLFAQGLDSTITELIKFRGGDSKAFNAMNRSIIDTGSVNLEYLSQFGTKVKSVTTLSVLLKTIHLDNTLDK